MPTTPVRPPTHSDGPGLLRKHVPCPNRVSGRRPSEPRSCLGVGETAVEPWSLESGAVWQGLSNQPMLCQELEPALAGFRQQIESGHVEVTSLTYRRCLILALEKAEEEVC